MATQTVDVSWATRMAFKAKINEHEIVLDLEESAGGTNLGPKPKPLLLVALGGCTAMDVISILKKMKIEPEYFNVKVEGDVNDDHPKRFNKIRLIYEFRGENLPLDKLRRAIELSQDHYCGVSDTLKKALEITYEIKILNSVSSVHFT